MTRTTVHQKKTIVIYGGRSGEHEVSLRSASSVIRHLKTSSEQLCLIAIDKQGLWSLQPDSLIEEVRKGANLHILPGNPLMLIPSKGFFFQDINGLNEIECEIVFPVLHGSFGEDGTIQGLFELLGVPYVGSGVLASSLGMDKEKIKSVWFQAGLPIVPYKTLHRHLFNNRQIKEIWSELNLNFSLPFFVKPSRGGSSVGISRVQTELELLQAIEFAFKFDTKILIEPGIDAREIEVAILGNDEVRAFVPGEIVPSHEFYDYDAKYLDPNGAHLQIPADIDVKQTESMQTIAIQAYKLCEAKGLSRVDFFLDKKTGDILLNEINTMPGFTNVSMYPMMAEASGLPYSELLEALIDLGKKEFQIRSNLLYSMNEA